MKHHKEKLEMKLQDFRRFTVTLLILASYLYMGTVINTYIHYSPDGRGLAVLSFVVTAAAALFMLYSHYLKQKIKEKERA
ncbi:YrhC family protein [Lentibacillus juripiscarius]|uniref:YrhC family protein n=1 Tax=Lentibacillus juripiscarius TaxID=257446 RepID=A0ABW5V0J3_9BACI